MMSWSRNPSATLVKPSATGGVAATWSLSPPTFTTVRRRMRRYRVPMQPAASFALTRSGNASCLPCPDISASNHCDETLNTFTVAFQIALKPSQSVQATPYADVPDPMTSATARTHPQCTRSVCLPWHRFMNGFTLIELTVTLAIAVILLTIGIPSFQERYAN